jgi:serine/threonine-protein kinase
VDLAEGSRIDRYVVDGLIGRGGMATVYRVRHLQLGTLHALKVLALHSPGLAERMLLEGRVQARLSHPNVLSVTDVIDAGGGVPGLLMEYVRGPSLDEVVRVGRLPFAVIDDLVAGVVAGVAAAHHAGVVHRDLKPANILLSLSGRYVLPKVADFGLVKVIGDAAPGHTRTGTTMGTPGYMSPEQIKDAKDVDARADLFALGCILYELISGERAFSGESTFEIFDRVTRGSFPPVQEVAPHAPARMVEAIEAALVLDPASRVPSCLALWELWSGGATDLDAAVAARRSWPDDFRALLEEAWSEKSVSRQAPVLVTTTGTYSPAHTDVPASWKSWRTVVAGLAVVLLVGALAWGAVRFASSSTPTPAPRQGEIREAAAPGPPADPEPVSTPELSAVSPEQPPAPVVPRLPLSGEVVLAGDPSVVRLVPIADGASVSPGLVRIGRYRVEAVFDGVPTETGLVLDVRPGQRVVLRCVRALRNCTVD